MTRTRLAVIGVGHLGRIHARLLAQVAEAELIGIVDPAPEARAEVSAQLGVPAYPDHSPLLGQIDAAIVAAPSKLHYSVAQDLLARGVHVLVEKPLTLNVGDADDLVRLAAARGLVLQVGHVERFNPALVAASGQVQSPKYIDAVRAGPYSCRSTDTGVVLDLMIHDIDAVLSLVHEPLVAVEALGAAVLGPNEDWAQARLTFAGGCVANLWASRVAWEPQRSMQVVGCDCMARIDFAARKVTVMRPSEAVLTGQIDPSTLAPAERAHLKEHLFEEYLPVVELRIADSNPLLEEQRAFVAAVRGEAQVRVSGEDGRRALDVAERVLAQIAAHRWDGTSDGAVGPHFATRDAVLRGPHWRHSARVVGRRMAG